MDQIGEKHRPGAKATPATYTKVETQVQPDATEVHYGPWPQTMARTREIRNPPE